MNHSLDHQALDALIRGNLAPFIAKAFQVVSPGDRFAANWHIEVIADALERCHRREIKRLVITMPPRSLKSICASVAFPAWVLGQDPSRRVICASYGSELAAKFARDCRAVMETDWYRRAFPDTRLVRSAELDFETTLRGGRYATSVGGTLTGRGGNIIVIDDPLKPVEALSDVKRQAVNQWYDSTLFSRLDNKAEDVIILVMQRLHLDDLVAHVQEKEPWVQLDLPAIAERDEIFDLSNGREIVRYVDTALHAAREPLSELEKIKSTIGSHFFAAQYQQLPVPEGGAMVKRDWLRFYNYLPPKRPPDEYTVQSWDTASKAEQSNDYTVCTTWQGNYRGPFYLVHVLRERLEFPELRRRIVAHKDRFEADLVLIEDRGSGIQLIQDLKYENDLYPIAMDPKFDKKTRLMMHTPRIEAGQIILPKRAPWLDDFLNEILQFPQSRHDDQVDSLSQFLTWFADPIHPFFFT